MDKLEEIINKMLLDDNYCCAESVKNISNKIITNLNNLLESTNIIDIILLEIISIAVTPIINDIPILLHIILNSKNLIEHLLKLNIKKVELKYYIFSILYYTIINHNIKISQSELIKMFDLFWNLVSFDINKTINGKMNCYYFLNNISKTYSLLKNRLC